MWERIKKSANTQWLLRFRWCWWSCIVAVTEEQGKERRGLPYSRGRCSGNFSIRALLILGISFLCSLLLSPKPSFFFLLLWGSGGRTRERREGKLCGQTTMEFCSDCVCSPYISCFRIRSGDSWSSVSLYFFVITIVDMVWCKSPTNMNGSDVSSYRDGVSQSSMSTRWIGLDHRRWNFR